MFILGLHTRLTWTLTVTNTIVALMWLNMYAGCVALVHGFKSQSRLLLFFWVFTNMLLLQYFNLCLKRIYLCYKSFKNIIVCKVFFSFNFVPCRVVFTWDWQTLTCILIQTVICNHLLLWYIDSLQIWSHCVFVSLKCSNFICLYYSALLKQNNKFKQT